MKKIFFIIFFFITQISAMTLGEATMKAHKENKLIMVFVEMNGCPYCRAMEREIFHISQYMDEIEKRYVFVKINRNNTPFFLHPKYYPTTYLLKDDGFTIIDELPGYMKKDDFLPFINEVYRQEFGK